MQIAYRPVAYRDRSSLGGLQTSDLLGNGWRRRCDESIHPSICIWTAQSATCRASASRLDLRETKAGPTLVRQEHHPLDMVSGAGSNTERYFWLKLLSPTGKKESNFFFYLIHFFDPPNHHHRHHQVNILVYYAYFKCSFQWFIQ